MGYIYVIVLDNTHPLGHYARGIKHEPIQGQTWVVVGQEKVWVVDSDGKLVRLIEANPNCLLHEGGPKQKGRLYGGANSHGSVRKLPSPKLGEDCYEFFNVNLAPPLPSILEKGSETQIT